MHLAESRKRISISQTLVLIWALVCFATATKAQDADTFELNLHFVIATTDLTDLSRETIETAITDQVEVAETLFNASPSLEINVTTEWNDDVAQVETGELIFETVADQRRYMDEHFDIVARSKTDGYVPILIVDRYCNGWIDGADKTNDADRRCPGGSASFPHSVKVFQRKHGITLTTKLLKGAEWSLAHELGHMFGLRHTFDTYKNVSSSKNCNRDFGSKGQHCNSCDGEVSIQVDGDTACTGDVNLMDYCVTDADFTLNTCQINRAAKQRERYLTTKGATDYFELKGTRGQKICSKDTDCAGTEYCDKGTATIGRNLCKAKKPIGKSCTRKKQCVTDRCRFGKCRN